MGGEHTRQVSQLSKQHNNNQSLKSHQALVESEEKFSKALELSPDAVVITRLADGQILEVNDACRN